MHGGLAAAQIIIIHAGQIIMHQRIGVQHFNRRRHAQGRVARHVELRRAFQHQETAQPFAAAHAGIAHGFKQPRLIAFRRRDQGIKRAINFGSRCRHGGSKGLGGIGHGRGHAARYSTSRKDNPAGLSTMAWIFCSASASFASQWRFRAAPR